jgi:hypothetical protein
MLLKRSLRLKTVEEMEVQMVQVIMLILITLKIDLIGNIQLIVNFCKINLIAY